jgi:Integrase core domain
VFSSNSPIFASRRTVDPLLIEKGSPQQNAFVERFNGTMRDEVLNGEEFDSLLEARVVIGNWLLEYNTLRPHCGLGMMTPAAYAARPFRAARLGRSPNLNGPKAGGQSTPSIISSPDTIRAPR